MGVVLVSFCVCVHMRTISVPKVKCFHNEYKVMGCKGEGRVVLLKRRSFGNIFCVISTMLKELHFH